MAPVNAPLWPSVACGNEGMKFVFAVMQIYLMTNVRSKDPHLSEWTTKNWSCSYYGAVMDQFRV
jgi:hypothetical protein